MWYRNSLARPFASTAAGGLILNAIFAFRIGRARGRLAAHLLRQIVCVRARSRGCLDENRERKMRFKNRERFANGGGDRSDIINKWERGEKMMGISAGVFSIRNEPIADRLTWVMCRECGVSGTMSCNVGGKKCCGFEDRFEVLCDVGWERIFERCWTGIVWMVCVCSILMES